MNEADYKKEIIQAKENLEDLRARRGRHRRKLSAITKRTLHAGGKRRQRSESGDDERTCAREKGARHLAKKAGGTQRGETTGDRAYGKGKHQSTAGYRFEGAGAAWEDALYRGY